jgi:hypothetical protein
MSNEQFFSYIMAKTSYTLRHDDICFAQDQHTTIQWYMSPPSQHIILIKANQSLLLLLKLCALIAEKQQIPIF